MILVVGGRCSGKLAYVKSLGYGQDDIAVAVLNDKPVLYHIEQMDFPLDEEALLEKEVLICDEVGSGIVPLEKADRIRREEIARLCTRLATQAQEVIRLVAGIPVKLK